MTPKRRNVMPPIPASYWDELRATDQKDPARDHKRADCCGCFMWEGHRDWCDTQHVRES